MNIENKWLCAPSVYEENWSATVFFETKQEAIKAGIDGVEKFNLDTNNESLNDLLGYYPDDNSKLVSFAVGQVDLYKLSIDSNDYFEVLKGQVYDEMGEFSAGFLDYVKEEHKNELDSLIEEWILKHRYEPSFFKVKNVEKITPLY